MNRVSILIPLYNSEQYIAETLESALAQTWDNTEIIVVDDGSTDNSHSIAKSFESPRLKVFQQSHKGASKARNLAFRNSTGDYIQYLDADDLLSPEKIERQMVYFKRFGDDICTSCKSVRFTKDRAIHRTTGEFVCKDYTNPLDYMADAWETHHYLGLHSWLIPREIVNKAGEWDSDLERFQDSEFIIRVLYRIKEVKFVPSCLSYYRDTPYSISKGYNYNIENSRCVYFTKIVTKVILSAKYEKITRAVIIYLSNSIYKWYPRYPDLVVRGMKTLKKLDSPLIIKNKSGYSKILILILGWRIYRILEIYYSRYSDKIKRITTKVLTKRTEMIKS